MQSTPNQRYFRWPLLKNRYLKFKFLTHYGDEFYCTVSQIKVHGSTMMESFHDEWQQSSAEVREVQDSLMLTKKDNTKAAANANGIGANGNGTKTMGTAPPPGAGSGSEGGTAPTSTPTRHPTKQQTPTSTSASGDGEAGVEHRPHAASAATVPPLAEKRAGTSPGGGGDIGTADLTVEDIVRGVPAEMVVPATTCSGPIGVDGVCHGKILTDIASGGGDAVAEGAGGAAAAAESKILATELPSMGASSGTRPSSGGAGGREKDAAGRSASSGAGDSGTNIVNGVVDGGPRQSGGAEQRVAVENTDDDMVGVSEAPGSAGRGATRDQREGLKSEVEITGEETGTGAGTSNGAPDSSAGGAGGDPVETTVRPTVQSVNEEKEPPPRKGILTSTMEAISKAVGGSDAGKKRRSDDSKTVEDAAAAGAHPSLGSSEGTATTADVSGSDSDVTGDGVVEGERGEVGLDDAQDGGGGIGVEVESQKSAEAGGGTAPDDSRTYPAMGADDGVPQPNAKETASTAAAGGGGGGSDGDGPDELKHAARDAAADSSSGGSGNVVSTSSPGRPPAQSDAPNRPRDQMSGDHDGSGGTGGAGGSHEVRQATVEGKSGEAGEALTAEVGGNPADAVGAVADVAPNIDPQAAADAGMDVGVGVVENDGADSVPEEVKGRAAGVSNAATAATGSSGDAESPASSERVGNQQDLPQSPAVEEAPREGRQQDLPSEAERPRWTGEGYEDDASRPAERTVPENLLQYTDAARVAACLDRLSFSEFRDQVLARTQQAQQSAGGGVAIGGQYESIFKTLMNKIKTLEINQSLFSLYVGECGIKIRTH